MITSSNNINVVDMIMGSGKTSACINYINTHKDNHYLYITTLLDEVENRILTSCKSFVTPEKKSSKNKLDSIKDLLKAGVNIASTHALFQLFDSEIYEICQSMNYILILDEVSDVIKQYDIDKYDLKALINQFVDIDDDNMLVWKKEFDNYNGRFVKEKKLCELRCLNYLNNSSLIWLFPVKFFESFKTVFILTYMFECQIMKYYFDYYKITYNNIYVKKQNGKYYFTTNKNESVDFKNDYKKLINICTNKKLNMIGDSYYSLSKSWYTKSEDKAIKLLKRNMNNYYTNICKSKSSENLWSTFKDYQINLQSNGCIKSYASLNCKSTNKYKDRKCIAYLANRFLNLAIKNFFISNNIYVDEEQYALSEMLQFIWRSSIRTNNNISIYVPSLRMRNLLVEWINKNSK